MTLLFGSGARDLSALFASASRALSHERRPDPSWNAIPPIWSGGLSERPRIALVFVNPTYRNQAARMSWPDQWRAPHVGIRRMWRFLAGCELASWDAVMALPRDQNWGYDDALRMYQDVADHGVYITNLVKLCGSSSAMPSLRMARDWAPLMHQELSIVDPENVIAMGQLVSSVLLGHPVKVSDSYRRLVSEGDVPSYIRPLSGASGPVTTIIPSYFPAGRGDPRKAEAIISHVAKATA